MKTLNYIFRVEYQPCAADKDWVERSQRWSYPNDSKASPYAIAGQGIRVTFEGLENPATPGIVTALSPFTLTLVRTQSQTPA